MTLAPEPPVARLAGTCNQNTSITPYVYALVWPTAGMSASVSADRQSQLDEVEFMAAMSREGEFQWEEDTLSGSVSGTLNVFLQLETVLSLRMLPPVKKPFLNKSTPLQLSGSPKAQGKHETNHGVGCQSDQVSVPSTGSTAAMKTNTSAVKSYSVLHLPPICLHFRFPSAYPSREMPEFTLSCKWLNFTQVCESEYNRISRRGVKECLPPFNHIHCTFRKLHPISYHAPWWET